MTAITNIDDLKTLYQRRVPKMFFDYCESGSYTEQTFRENSSDFAELKLRQKVAIDLSQRSTSATMLGHDISMPVALAPVGSTGMQHADGEIKSALAARDFGVPYTLSTMSINSMEQVAEATNAPFWFQVYTMTDDDFMRRLMDRAKAANVSALVITLDLQMLGQRHKDIKNGLTIPLRPTLGNMLDLATKWRWALQMSRAKSRTFGNVIGHIGEVTNPSNLAALTQEKFDLSLNWDRVRELRNMWDGPVILKGIMDADDARQAVNVGADGIIVSNHGGRQLDGALSSIRALEPVLDAVGDKTEVYLDSGVRSGQDVLKAMAMGAKGTFIGRSYIYGVGAMGQAGVTKALQIIHKELDTSMALCGCRGMDEVTRDILMKPADFSTRWS